MPYQHPEYLISSAELEARLDDPKLRIYDATVLLKPSENGPYRAESGEQKFQAGHIPGAMFLDLIDAASDTTTGLGFSLPNSAQLESLFRNLGIDNESEVVVYSTDNMMWATRAWWLLHYCGHSNVRILNGGFSAWVASDFDLSDQTTDYPNGSFTVDIKVDRFADKASVFKAIGDGAVCTVNALAPAMHSENLQSRMGVQDTSLEVSTSFTTIYSTTVISGKVKNSKKSWPTKAYSNRPK